jgi:tetratricopeptide (TPR) repeat protein
MKSIKLMAGVAGLLAMLTLLTGCAQEQAAAPSPMEGLTASSPSHDSIWSKMKAHFGGDKQALPQDRIEALGDAAVQTGDYESSLVDFLSILRKNPERYDLHYKVAVLFLINGQSAAAKQELALVLVHQPEMLPAHEAMGLVLLQEKNYPQAIEEFQTVLGQDPQRVNSLHLLGVAYLESGQPGKAVVQLKRALVLDPHRTSSIAALGQAYIDLKQYQQAIACLQQGLTLDPKNEKLNYQLGMALAAEKRYNEALDAFMKAGDEAQAYNNIGVHYFVAGQYEEAAKCFQRAMELRPSFYEEAKDNLQRALEKLQEVRQGDS